MDRIRTQNLRPEPRWHFILEKILSGSALFLLVLAAVISFGLVLELVHESSLPEIIRYSGYRYAFLSGLPFLWIVLCFSAVSLIVFSLKKNFDAYHYPLKYVLGTVLSLVFASGISTYTFGFSDQTEQYMEKNIPIYSKIVETPRTLWAQPDNGLLYGEIINDPVCNCVKIKDTNNDTWDVDEGNDGKTGNNDGNQHDENDQNIDETASGGPVKIIGEKTGENKFRIKKIIGPHVKGVTDDSDDAKRSHSRNNANNGNNNGHSDNKNNNKSSK